MSKFTDAKIKVGSKKRMPVRYMNHLNIPISNTDGKTFSGTVTLFVPQADTTKPVPKVGMTLTVGDSSIRIVGDSPIDLKEFLMTTISFLEEEEEVLYESLMKAKEQYYQKQQANQEQFEKQKRIRESLKENNIIPLKTA